MVAAYRRVMQALKVHKVEGVAPDDWKVYQAFQAVLTEGE
jgi:IS1 family transposase